MISNYRGTLVWDSQDGWALTAEIELEEILFWESQAHRDLTAEITAEIELDHILFWESQEGRDLIAEIEFNECMISISEEAIEYQKEYQREFDLERCVEEEARLWEESEDTGRMARGRK